VNHWLTPNLDALRTRLGCCTGLEATIIKKERVKQKGFATTIISAYRDEAVLALMLRDMVYSGLID